jgi:UDP-glucose 4-epimerase
MGMTKGLMEKVAQSFARNVQNSDTKIAITRYGNVMMSRGSVIPLFFEQIRQGKPITITDPLMTRFLMSLEESVDLVLHAFKHAQQGDIFVQKAPASTVADLAEALKELFKKNSSIKIIGTRHGEKLYESLISREEMAHAEDMGRYYRIPADNRDLNYAKFFSDGEKVVSEASDYTSHNTERLDIPKIKELLMKLEYIKGELNA